MNTQQRALNNYANRAADLAESVQADIRRDGAVSDHTVLALNDFIIAANEVANFIALLDKNKVTLN